MVDSFAAARISETPAIRVGDVLNQACTVFAARWAPFMGLSLIAFAPQFLFGLLVAKGAGGGIIGSVLQVACASFADAAIIYGVVQQLRGRGFTVAESLGAGFARLGPVFGLSLAVGFCVGLASVLLVIPGVIVWCMYAIAIPVCVVERRGVFDSMRRSAALTKGARWRIFGVFALIVLAATLVGVIVGALATLGRGLPLAVLAVYLVESAAGAFRAVTVGVLYHQLRGAREGVDIESIAAVFD
jgi:uncharacterized membrane protein